MAWAAAVSIFLSAFLLFLVQPMLGKMILPWFGGSPAVWTTCLLFFQVLLLGGYAYAAALARWLGPKRQAIVHTVLLAAAILLLPVTPGVAWKPLDGSLPALRILGLLTACVGAPYFLLSANSPLVQGWFAQTYPGKSPYRLYALSNVGSLGALLAYPFLIEPTLRTSQQGWIWSGLFVTYVAVSAFMTWRLSYKPTTTAGREVVSELQSSVGWRDRLLWLALPALSSMMLMAVTNHLCQDVAVVPFLWIAPLSIYLITLIICFDRDRWYRPFWFGLGCVTALLAAGNLSFVYYLANKSFEPLSRTIFLLRYDLRILIGVYLSLFFFACMLCHGEVVRRRPASNRLTEFYLTISAGSALGGLLVALACPAVFNNYFEIRIGLVICMCLALVVTWRELSLMADQYRASTKLKSVMGWTAGVISVCLVAMLVVSQYLSLELSRYAANYRNFYGALTVRLWYPEDDPLRGKALYHGTILHGYQFTSPGKEQTATTYYGDTSGVGKTMLAKRGDQPLKVGVVGLGVGTMACYARPGDQYRIYEINPLIIQLATRDFTFITGCQGKVEIVSGDARLSLERESEQQFDVLVLDAFSGDSIPVHLLTREAMHVYLRHMKPDGIIAVHISNRYVELLPVVASLGEEFNLHAADIHQSESEGLHVASSEWLLLTPSSTVLDHPSLVEYRFDVRVRPKFEVWTDDFNNLLKIMRAP